MEKHNKSISQKLEKTIKRNIVLFALGNAVSSLGTYMYNFAIGLYVLKLTGSGSLFAIAVLFGMIPRIILSPFAGALADKVDRKKMAITMDILSGILLLSMFALSQFTALTLTYVFISSALLTVFNTFFGVSIGASIPNLVDEERLLKINSIRAMVDSLSQLAGPLLGGLVYATIGIKLFLLVNGISFICSGISETFINFNIFNKTISDKTKSENMITSMKEGFKYLKNHDLLIGILKYALFINFFATGISIILPFISVEELNATPTEYGILQLGFPLGFLVMSALYSIIKKDTKNIFKSTAKGMLLFGIAYICFSLPTSPLLINSHNIFKFSLIFLISFFMGVIILSINIPLQVMMQKSIDDEYRGRVGGVMSMASQLISPLGLIIYGFLIDHVDSFILPIVSGILVILISLIMFNDKKMINLGR